MLKRTVALAERRSAAFGDIRTVVDTARLTGTSPFETILATVGV